MLNFIICAVPFSSFWYSDGVPSVQWHLTPSLIWMCLETQKVMWEVVTPTRRHSPLQGTNFSSIRELKTWTIFFFLSSHLQRFFCGGEMLLSPMFVCKSNGLCTTMPSMVNSCTALGWTIWHCTQHFEDSLYIVLNHVESNLSKAQSTPDKLWFILIMSKTKYMCLTILAVFPY